MLRLLHSSDYHLTEGQRFDSTLKCLTAMVDDALAQQVGLSLVLGDLSGVTVPHMMTTAERNALGPLFQRLASVGPVIILQGNHDLFAGGGSDLDEFALLEATHAVHVVSEPRMILIPDRALVLAFPYPHKREWLGETKGSIEEQLAAIQEKIAALLVGWKEHADRARAVGLPVVLAAHATFAGALVAGGEVMPAGQEVELQVAVLEAMADYAAGGHIHLCQEMGPKTWYCGSPDRSNFGETDPKGWLIVDVEPGEPPKVYRRLSPARQYRTLIVTYTPEGGIVWSIPPAEAGLDGAETRVAVCYAEEHAATLPLDEIRAAVAATGAADVKLQRRPTPTVRVRSEAILTAHTMAEKVSAYWQSLGQGAPDAATRARCLEKLAAVEQEVG